MYVHIDVHIYVCTCVYIYVLAHTDMYLDTFLRVHVLLASHSSVFCMDNAGGITSQLVAGLGWGAFATCLAPQHSIVYHLHFDVQPFGGGGGIKG